MQGSTVGQWGGAKCPSAAGVGSCSTWEAFREAQGCDSQLASLSWGGAGWDPLSLEPHSQLHPRLAQIHVFLGLCQCRRWHLVLGSLLQSPVHGQGWVGTCWPCSLGCHLAGTGETPTLSTLDFYMAKLHSAIESNPLQHEPLVLRVKEILSRIAR